MTNKIKVRIFFLGILIYSLSTVIARAQTGTPINAGYVITACGYTNVYRSLNSGKDWAPSPVVDLEFNRSYCWEEALTSGNPQKITVIEFPFAKVYSSSDEGATWIYKGTANNYLMNFVSSDDAQTLVGMGYNGQISISHDGGISWSAGGILPMNGNIGNNIGNLLLSSGDGEKLLAYTGALNYLYTSSDGGLTWQQTSILPLSSSASYPYGRLSYAISNNGQEIIAAGYIFGEGSNYMYKSLDGGATWIPLTSAGSHNWGNVQFSSDGQKILAQYYDLISSPTSYSFSSRLYISSDDGNSWITNDAIYNLTTYLGTGGSVIPPQIYAANLPSDVFGQKLFAILMTDSNINNGGFYLTYISEDGGTTWVPSIPFSFVRNMKIVSNISIFYGVGALRINSFPIYPNAPSFLDIGLRVMEKGKTSATAIAIDPSGTNATAPLMISKNATSYHVALVDPSDPNATTALIKMTDDTIKALRKYTP